MGILSRFWKWNTNVLSFNIEVFQGEKSSLSRASGSGEKGLLGLDFKSVTGR